MIVIIAEKPSLGRTIASALLGNFNKKNGYVEKNGIVVTWAFGHLFALKDVNDYPGHTQDEKWSDVPLPFQPEHFEFTLKKDVKTKKVDEGIKQQFNVICSLINSPNCDEIVCAGDADREGEVIVRLILQSGLKPSSMDKKITRLWLPEQTPDTIRQAFKNRPLDSDYNNLFNEGLARTYMDWLMGINLTRSLTLKSRTVLPVGRVVCPIVLAIYQRDKEIKDFVPKPYKQISSKTPLVLNSDYKYDLNQIDDANHRLQIYNQNPSKIIKVTKKEKTISSPKLFSMSKLQGYCGQKFKYSPNETLEIVQNLYEKGFVTYPRTNTEYLSENEKNKVKELLKIHDKNGYTEFKDTKRIFDNSKIESHSALTPTTMVAHDLSDKETNVYQTIKNRFLSVFWKEPYIVKETEIQVQAGNEETNEIMKTKGTILISKGWTVIEENTKKDVELPDLTEGQEIHIAYKLEDKVTSPPKKYTVESLNSYLKNPFKAESTLNEVEQSDDEDYKALLDGCEIGTEATRAGIIDKAIQIQYISLKKNVYSIEEKGIYLVNLMRMLHLDMGAIKTVELQKTLKKVYKNTNTIDDAIAETRQFLNDYFSQNDDDSIESFQQQHINNQEPVGKCPWCNKDLILINTKDKGSMIVHKEKNENCKFFLLNSIFVYGTKCKLSDSALKRLASGKSIPINMISNKTGNPYKVRVTLTKEKNITENGTFPKFDIQFDNGKTKKSTRSASSSKSKTTARSASNRTKGKTAFGGYNKKYK